MLSLYTTFYPTATGRPYHRENLFMVKNFALVLLGIYTNISKEDTTLFVSLYNLKQYFFMQPQLGGELLGVSRV